MLSALVLFPPEDEPEIRIEVQVLHLGNEGHPRRGDRRSCKGGKATTREPVINSAATVGSWGLSPLRKRSAGVEKARRVFVLKGEGSWDVKKNPLTLV